MATSITWNGTDLSIHGFVITQKKIPVLPDMIFNVHAAIGGDSLTSAVNYTMRQFSLDCAVTGNSELDLQTNMDAVLNLLNPLVSDRTLIIDDESNRRYVARVTGITEPIFEGHWGKGFTVSFQGLAHKQELAETNASIAIATDPDVLVTPVITGNAVRIPVEIYVRNETGASTTGTITVANGTTSETISWKGTLEDDRWLRFGTIDTLGRFSATIEKSDSTGADPEAEAYTSVESGYQSGDWCRLRGGVTNSFTITGISTGTLETTYRGRFI